MDHIGTTMLAPFFEAVGAGIAVLEIRDRHTAHLSFANSRFIEMYQLSSFPMRNVPLAEALPASNTDNYLTHLVLCLEQKRAVEFTDQMGGNVKWWGVIMAPVFDEKDAVSHIIVTSVDVSEKMELEHRIRESNARLAAIVNSAHDGIVSTDEQQHIKTFNKAAQEIFGYQESEIIGKPLTTLIPERFRPGHSGHVEEFARSSVSSREMFTRGEVAGRHKDGSEHFLEISIAKIMVDGGQEYLAILRDISERMKYIEELKLHATTDPLTGCSNRRHLIQRAEIEIERLRRHGHGLAVILLDADHFKRINDTHGHEAGDMVLKAIGATCLKLKRKNDVIARWGGEEFCLLLPDSSLQDARQLAERLRQAISTLALTLSDGSELGGITASFGVATFSDAGQDIDQVVHLADSALYSAKQNGRNRVESAPAIATM